MIKDDWSSILVVPLHDWTIFSVFWLAPLFGSFLNGRSSFVYPCLVPRYPWTHYSGRYGLAVVRERGVKGTICVTCSSSSVRSRFNFLFSAGLIWRIWCDKLERSLIQMLIKEWLVPEIHGPDRPDLIALTNMTFRVKIEAKSVSLTEKRFMLPKRSLMAKNVTVSLFLESVYGSQSPFRSKVGS